MTDVHVVLMEWMGYPLFRKKVLGEHTIKCGLGGLLHNIAKHDAGLEFDCSVILNSVDNVKRHAWLNFAGKVQPFKTLLHNSPITNSKEKYEGLIKNYPFVQNVCYRGNTDQDIGAYDFAYGELQRKKYEGDVLFINSSVRGPSKPNWLSSYRDLFYRNSDTGLCGITLNSHDTSIPGGPFAPHVQSFFLYSNMQVLAKVFPNGLIGGKSNLDKGDLILEGEIGISKQVLDAGFGICCSAFPKFYYKYGDKWAIPTGDVRYIEKYKHLANHI